MPEKNVKKVLVLTPRMADMILDIKEKRGLVSEQEVIRHAISEMYGKTFPAYSGTRKRLSPDQQAAEDERVEQARHERLIADKTALCDRLGGEVKEDEGGTPVCHYFTYTGKKRYPQEVPVEMLDEDMVKTQYQPSRQKVLALQKEGKVDYEIDKKKNSSVPGPGAGLGADTP